MPDAKASLAEFVGLLRPASGQSSGWHEVRCLNQQAGQPPYENHWINSSENPDALVEAVLRADRNPNALTCIAPSIRIQQSHRGPEGYLPVLWSDIDFKGFPDGEKGAKASILTLDAPSPHAIVRSGHGFHAYWRLHEPFDATSSDGVERATRMLRRIAHATGGDMAPAQPAAVLRAPDTWNRKSEPHTLALVTKWSPDLPGVSFESFSNLPEVPTGARNGTLVVPATDGIERLVIEQLNLPRTARDLIRFGVPEGADESSAAQSVITSLLRSGYDDTVIFQLFRQTPQGIGHSWHKRGNDGNRWLSLSISRAQERMPRTNATTWEPEDIASALSADVQAPEMLISGLLAHGEVSSIVADGGVGKSWLADIIGFHMATGVSLWGRHVKGPLRVLVVQEEMSRIETLDRLRRIRKCLPVDDEEVSKAVFKHVYQTGFELTNLAPLVKELEAHPYDVVFIDSLAATSGEINTDTDNSGTQQLMQRLKFDVAIKYNCHIIIIHHTKKLDGPFNIRQAYRGVSSFKGVLNNMWVLEKMEDTGHILLHIAKARGFKEPDEPLALKIRDTEDGGVTISVTNLISG